MKFVLLCDLVRVSCCCSLGCGMHLIIRIVWSYCQILYEILIAIASWILLLLHNFFETFLSSLLLFSDPLTFELDFLQLKFKPLLFFGPFPLQLFFKLVEILIHRRPFGFWLVPGNELLGMRGWFFIFSISQMLTQPFCLIFQHSDPVDDSLRHFLLVSS